MTSKTCVCVVLIRSLPLHSLKAPVQSLMLWEQYFDGKVRENLQLKKRTRNGIMWKSSSSDFILAGTAW